MSQSHKKFYYRIVEQYSERLLIKRNGFIFAPDSQVAMSKLSNRYNLIGGATIEETIEDHADFQNLYPIEFEYKFI